MKASEALALLINLSMELDIKVVFQALFRPNSRDNLNMGFTISLTKNLGVNDGSYGSNAVGSRYLLFYHFSNRRNLAEHLKPKTTNT